MQVFGHLIPQLLTQDDGEEEDDQDQQREEVAHVLDGGHPGEEDLNSENNDKNFLYTIVLKLQHGEVVFFE
jgi:hypothetical protein